MRPILLSSIPRSLIAGAIALAFAVGVAFMMVSSTGAPLLGTDVLGAQLEQLGPVTPGARIVEPPPATASTTTTTPRTLDLSVLGTIELPVQTTAAPETTVPTTVAPETTTTTAAETTTSLVTSTSIGPDTTVVVTAPIDNEPVRLPKPDLIGIGDADSGERCTAGDDPQLAQAIPFAGEELAGLGDARVGRPVPFTLDCGDLVFTMVSSDSSHGDAVTDGQDNERWRVEFLDTDGASLGTTEPTQDLPDTAVVGTSQLLVQVPAGTTHIRPIHIGSDADEPNTVVAVGIVATSPLLVADCGLPEVLVLAPNSNGSVGAACASYIAVLLGDPNASVTMQLDAGTATVSHDASEDSAVVLVAVQA